VGEQDPEEIRRQALAYLASHTVMTLATDGPEGLWAAAVFYAHDHFELIFLSAGHTRHGQNLAANPQAAATIQENYDDWPQIQGIQLAGAVRLLNGEERRAAISLYQEKYPFIKTAGLAIQAALKKVNWYRLMPQQFFFIDNRKGFGHRDEVELPAI
jgi:uncharacterized protein YhbP (UPF0306 family)